MPVFYSRRYSLRVKSFRLFATTNRHDYCDFDKLYACFVSYIGRERLRGNAVALSYQFDMARCQKEYDDIWVKGTLDRSNASAVALIRTSIQQHPKSKSDWSLVSISSGLWLMSLSA
jgi:hypothetical protein